LYAICSEVQEKATRALIEWNLNHHTALVGDNDNLLLEFFQDSYLPTLHLTDTTHKQRGPMNHEAYPNGIVQPAVLGMVGGQPAMAWACQPSPANLHGSIGRPDPSEVEACLETCLDAKEQGRTFHCSDGHELIPVVSGYRDLCAQYTACCTIM
jgi:hypothetical protein